MVLRQVLRLTAAWLAGLIVLAWPGVAGAAPGDSSPPRLRAVAAIVVDGRSGDVLLERNADRRRPIASATKLMTALLALERLRPNQVLTAPAYRALPIESKIDLRAGERMAVRDLLRALLLESANDAAATLADGVAGSRPAFVRQMNRRARELGLADTRYANPIGLDDPANYSNARDLARLTRMLMRDRRFTRVVDLPRAQLRSGARPRVVANRNLLVRREPFVTGVKTGYTRAAGYVLVGSASGRGARVISVVLGEPSPAARDSDSLALLRFGIDLYLRLRVFSPRRPLAQVPIAGRGDERADLVVARTVALTVKRGEAPTRRVNAPSEIEGPLAAAARVGWAEAVLDGRVVARAPLVTARAVPGPSRASRLVGALWLPVLSLLALFAVTLIGLRMRALRLRRARTRR